MKRVVEIANLFLPRRAFYAGRSPALRLSDRSLNSAICLKCLFYKSDKTWRAVFLFIFSVVDGGVVHSAALNCVVSAPVLIY
jgi:hypothetical protein